MDGSCSQRGGGVRRRGYGAQATQRTTVGAPTVPTPTVNIGQLKIRTQSTDAW